MRHVPPFWAILASPWALLGLSWGPLGPSGGYLGPSWLHLRVIFGPPSAHLGPSWAHLWPCSAHLGAILGHLGVILATLDPSWTHFGLTLAVQGARNWQKHVFCICFSMFLLCDFFRFDFECHASCWAALGPLSLTLGSPLLARFPFPC